MTKKLTAALAFAFLASCASHKNDSCPTCPITGKPLGKTPSVSTGDALAAAKKGAAATPQGQALNAASGAASAAQNGDLKGAASGAAAATPQGQALNAASSAVKN